VRPAWSLADLRRSPIDASVASVTMWSAYP